MPITALDLKYVLRLLVKRPFFTFVTVLVLTGGLAISLYTFSVLNTMVYRDLPIPDGGSVVRIGVGAWPNFEPLDAFELAALRKEAASVTELGAYRSAWSLVGEREASRSVRSAAADWRVFEFTRTPPLLGRSFVREDALPAGEAVAVLSHATWQTVFAGDPGVIGALVTIDDRQTRVVGVMPERYSFPMNIGLWTPLAEATLDPAEYSGTFFDAYARLRPGASTTEIETELSAILERVREQQGVAADAEPVTVSAVSFQGEAFGVFGTVVFGVLNLLSISILLMAAVNVGNLLLARTNERVREIGVRLALGAPRVRLVAQTMMENVVICAAGGALALLLAVQGLAATDGFMRALLGSFMPFWWTWGLDGDLVAAAALLLLLTVVVVSVLPAFCVTTIDPNSLLKDGTRTAGGLRPGRISRALLMVQIALISAVILVGGVVYFIAERATAFDFGLDQTNLVSMSVEPPADRYDTAERRAAFYESLLRELQGSTAIEGAFFMNATGRARFALEGTEYDRIEDRPSATRVVLSPLSSSVGPLLLQGRGFDGRDNATGVKTALVSESFARKHWPNESPLGRYLDISVDETTQVRRVVVGVVGDLQFDPLGITRMGTEAIHVPLSQADSLNAQLLARHFGNESLARTALYEALARTDPAIVPGVVQSYAAVLEMMTLFARTVTKLFAGCGLFAILLAITGIYAMTSNAVQLKSQEIGVRRALGASNGSVLTLFMRQGSRQLGIGLAASALLSAAVLFGVGRGFSVGTSTLLLIAAGVVLVVSATVLVATYLAVRGVIRVEPSTVLRS